MCGHEDDRREYTLQEQGKLPSQIRVWFIKTSGQLLFEEGKPKKNFLKDIKVLPSKERTTQYTPLVWDFKIKWETLGESLYLKERHENYMKNV